MHNMMIEERMSGLEEKFELDSDAIVGEGVTPVYGLHTTADGVYKPVPPPSSISALCETPRFTRNEREYKRTHELVMEHL